MTTAELRDAIPVLADRIYLNCGWAGPSPLPVLEAIRELLDLEITDGPAAMETVARQEACLADARRAVSGLLGARPDQIALTGNTTTGIGLVAAGLDWRSGDEVLISDQEHISNALPWYELRRRFGVIVREIPAHLDVDPMLSEYEHALSDRTRLISVSHVLWSTGRVMPVAELANLIHERGGWMVVDGAQSAGQLPIDVGRLAVDCYTIPGQKWLLGPLGTGATHFSSGLTNALSPSHAGWASLDFNDEEPKLWPGARRFETATISAALYAGLHRAITCIESVGIETIRARIQQLVTLLRARLEGVSGVRVLSPAESDRRTGILTVQVSGEPSEVVLQRLSDQHHIIARSIPHLDAVRLSIHAYNTEEELVQVAGALSRG